MIFDAPPTIVAPAEQPPAPVFTGTDGSPYYLLGINAYGSEEDVACLEGVASEHGWPAERGPEGSRGNTVKLMIMFSRASSDDVRAFLDRANRGEFGRFSFESMMLPVRDAVRDR